jgi:predicted permease
MWNDIRLAARLLAKNRGFTIAAVTALAIGMSATITMFTLGSGVYLRDLPFAAPDRIVSVETRYLTATPSPFDNMSFLDLQDLQASARLFDGIGAADEDAMDLADEEHTAERFVGAWVSANAFSLIGHRPALGRGFTSEDDRAGAEPTVILGHSVWQRRYGADPGILGERVRINGISTTVIGVMPEGFGFPHRSELWQPLAIRSGDDKDERGVRNIDAFGRMASAVTIEQAEADLARVMGRLAREFPETNGNVGPRLRPFRDVTTSGPIQTVFAGLMGAAVFLLLIACANVANLLLARGAARAREMSVRLSLGATRRRIVRQLLAESLLLAIAAGTVGLSLAVLGVRLFQRSIVGTGEPYWLRFPIEGGVVAFCAAVCLGTAVLCGLAPALHTTKISLHDALSEAGRATTGTVRARRWTDGFVILQLALSLTMLAGAGLMMRNVQAFSRLDAGVDTTGLVAAQVNLPAQRYPAAGDRRIFYRQLSERLAALPGMRAGIASAAPLRGAPGRTVSIDGTTTAAGDRPTVFTVAVGPGYLEALGVRALRGRLFTDTDEASAGQLVIVNERFAELHFSGGEAVGRSIRLDPVAPAEDPGGPLTIIGVVPNVRQVSPRQQAADARGAEPVAYLPYAAAPLPSATIVVRSGAGTPAVASALRNAIRAVDDDVPLSGVMPLDEAMAQEVSILALFSAMFGLFAAVALSLATIGLYAVMAYAVTQRTREVGVRVALGARARHVGWLVTRQAAMQLGVGIALGLAGALAAGQLLQGLLWGVSSRDPLTLVGVPALMIVVAFAACIVPARRAMRLDPVAALRAE